MIESSKAMVRIEYERNGITRIIFGEVNESKLEALHAGEESFICIRNDGEVKWVDKENILSIYELEAKLTAYEKCSTEEASFVKII